jgi:phage-related protein (TIGR01555 family)
MRKTQRRPRTVAPTVPQKSPTQAMKRALMTMATDGQIGAVRYAYDVKPPTIVTGVVPDGERPAIAMDEGMNASIYQIAQNAIPGGGFAGYPYLSMLSCRAEYRNMASAMATELTREWIKFSSAQNEGDDSNDKIKAIEAEFKRLNVQSIISQAAQHDCFFGRAHIWLELRDQDAEVPLVLSSHTIPKGSLKRIKTVEPVWTTPATYNSNDPTAVDFFAPPEWFMLGRRVHASRLLTIITRPVADILKPAFNFGGLSLTQIAEPYVDNWLRTRQSVSDLLNNFSITALATSMDQILQGEDDAGGLLARAKLFTSMRSNQGLMLLDKGKEELVQINTPLSGLHELQSQAQEQLCAVSRMPAIILTGISPSGLNASSDGEIRVFYDWITAQQNAYWRDPLETILKVVQLSLFGEIDPDITLDFVPLYQLTDAERADLRLKNAQTDDIYVNNIGAVSGAEVRDRLASDPESGYRGLDASVMPEPLPDPSQEEPPFGQEGAEDKSTSEAQRKAMEAAAHGHSTIGIPEKVGEEFAKKDESK